jgi:hypothetical protein
MTSPNALLDDQVYAAATSIGPGTVRGAIVWDLWYDGIMATPRQVGAALQRLQRKGLMFNHDAHGSLAIWDNDIRCRYWSGRPAIDEMYGAPAVDEWIAQQ